MLLLCLYCSIIRAFMLLHLKLSIALNTTCSNDTIVILFFYILIVQVFYLHKQRHPS
jgi:hypothetical protein